MLREVLAVRKDNASIRQVSHPCFIMLSQVALDFPAGLARNRRVGLVSLTSGLGKGTRGKPMAIGPIPACHLALSPLHAELPGRGRSPRSKSRSVSCFTFPLLCHGHQLYGRASRVGQYNQRLALRLLPLKATEVRRHHIPKQRHCVTNRAAYKAALRQRGSPTVRLTEAAIAVAPAKDRRASGDWHLPAG